MINIIHPLRLFLALLVANGFAGHAAADAWEPSRIRTNGAAFLAGFVSTYAAHELGHVVVADSLGFDTDFDGPTIIYPNAMMTDSERLQVSSAGLQAQWVVSEAALRYRNGRQLSAFGDNFNAGLVGAHLAITAAYMTVLTHHKDGDVQGISDATGMSNEQVAALVAIPALLDTWRLFGSNVPKWVPALSAGSKGIGLTMIWTY